MLVENELKKLKTFDSSYFRDKNHFEEDDTQKCLVFQPMNKYFRKITNTELISEWKSKGLSNEIIITPTTYTKITPTLKYTGKEIDVKFDESCLKQDKITFNHGKIVSIYIVYDLKSTPNNFALTLEDFYLEQVN